VRKGSNNVVELKVLGVIGVNGAPTYGVLLTLA
jgi:hypothetical protein